MSRWPLALALLTEMSSSQVQPDVVSFSALISTLQKRTVTLPQKRTMVTQGCTKGCRQVKQTTLCQSLLGMRLRCYCFSSSLNHVSLCSNMWGFKTCQRFSEHDPLDNFVENLKSAEVPSRRLRTGHVLWMWWRMRMPTVWSWMRALGHQSPHDVGSLINSTNCWSVPVLMGSCIGVE